MTDPKKNFFQKHAGLDAYFFFLFLLFVALVWLGRLFRPLWIPAAILLFYLLFRFFSKGRENRQVENARFLALVQSIVQWFRHRRNQNADRDHAYFKCPNCGQPMRIPKGLGTVEVTCRSCGTQFSRKS